MKPASELTMNEKQKNKITIKQDGKSKTSMTGTSSTSPTTLSSPGYYQAAIH